MQIDQGRQTSRRSTDQDWGWGFFIPLAKKETGTATFALPACPSARGSKSTEHGDVGYFNWRSMSRNDQLLPGDQLVEALKVAKGCVRDNAEFNLVLSPINPLVASEGSCVGRPVRFLGGPHENIDEMPAAHIDERGDRAALNIVQPRSLQCKTFIRKIANREGKFKSVVEPLPYDLLIVGSDACHVSRLQRMPMHSDNFPGEFRLIVATANIRTHSRHPQCDKQERGGNQPLPKQGS